MANDKQYKTALFKITAKTNLHVGSGSNDYGIIDNLVQRDSLTKFPVIHSSSLKGAIRAFAEYENYKFIDTVFGAKLRDTSDENGKPKNENQQAGMFRFFDAKLLAMPVQSSTRMFDLITCAEIEDDLKSTLKLFGISTTLTIKDIEKEITEIESKEFKKAVSDYELPVIARNQLDNGVSKNLWYEQVMPRESVFYFVLLYPANMCKMFDELKGLLIANPVQIGANASIGYGFCKIEEIKTEAKHEN